MQKWLKSCVSIVIPVYNVEDYLVECVESVCNQTYDNLQIVLIDDGSTDTSGLMCEKLKNVDERIRVVHKENGGLSDARNTGICYATGEYVFYLDSDDYLEPDAIEILVKMAETEGADIVVGNYFYTYSDNETVAEFQFETEIILSNYEAMEALVTGKIQNFAWGKLIKRELAEKYQFPKGKLFEDHYWAHLIFGEAQKVAVTNKTLLHYRQRDKSISYTFNINRLDVLEGWIVRKEYIEKKYADLLEKYLEYLSKSYVSIAWMIMTKMQGSRKVAFGKLKDCNRKLELQNYSTGVTKKLICRLEQGDVIYMCSALFNRIFRG